MQSWVRNFAIAWLSQFICMIGFSAVFPFLPLYVEHLGVSDPDQVKLWAGWISTGGAVSMALLSPVWGAIADRRGRKLMVQRAAFAGAISMALMGLVRNPAELLVLRTIQGAFTGTVAAFTALVASTTPRDKSGMALGLMQVSVYIGHSGGPFVGGFMADTLGYRTTFMVGGSMLLLAGIVATFFLRENFTPRISRRESAWSQAGSLLKQQTVLAMVLIVFGLYFSGSLLAPILPLFIQSLVTSQERLATTAGSIQGAQALSSAISSVLIGRVADRLGHRRVLITCALGVAAIYIPVTFVTNTVQLLLLKLLAGVFIGGLIPVTNAFIALHVDEGRQGATYGLTASAGAAGRAISPTVGSLVAVVLSMRALFPVVAASYALIAVLVGVMLPRKPHARAAG